MCDNQNKVEKASLMLVCMSVITEVRASVLLFTVSLLESYLQIGFANFPSPLPLMLYFFLPCFYFYSELKITTCHTVSFSSGQFHRSVVSDYLQPHGLQHARLPTLSPSSAACSKSCPSSGWYHPTISSSVVPFSSCLQSFPASGSFPMSQFFI